MNKQKPILFGILILIALVVAIVAMAANYQAVQEKTPAQKPDEQREVSEALRRGGYREAARLKGHVVIQIDPTWDWAGFDLETLTKSSAAVVVGDAGEGKGQLSRDGNVITTDYEVTIVKSLKGNFRQGNTIQVAMLGGKIEFDDGTSAEVQTPGFEKMVKGKRYLLFLATNRNNSPVLLLTGGPQGLFEIAGNEIKAFGRATDTVSKQASKRGSDDLLREIEEYAAKWPDPEGCCK